jgi:hypothetical protein
MAEVKTQVVLPPAPPEDKVEVATAFAAPICPHTGKPCQYMPPCTLPLMTGRTYCVDWVADVRAKAAKALADKGRP